MAWITVPKSSRIRAYQWIPHEADVHRHSRNREELIRRRDTIGTLMLEFTNGAVWSYFEIPARVFELWLSDVSPGSAFNRLIRGKFREAPGQHVESKEPGAVNG